MRMLAMLLLLFALSSAQAGQDWTIGWYSIDGGGTMSASAREWELKGTIGQPDATQAMALKGGRWSLTGGFWAYLADIVDRIFSDRFQARDD